MGWDNSCQNCGLDSDEIDKWKKIDFKCYICDYIFGIVRCVTRPENNYSPLCGGKCAKFMIFYEDLKKFSKGEYEEEEKYEDIYDFFTKGYFKYECCNSYDGRVIEHYGHTYTINDGYYCYDMRRCRAIFKSGIDKNVLSGIMKIIKDNNKKYKKLGNIYFNKKMLERKKKEEEEEAERKKEMMKIQEENRKKEEENKKKKEEERKERMNNNIIYVKPNELTRKNNKTRVTIMQFEQLY